MRLLLTGGAGYIGSVVAEHCISAGYDLVIIDSLIEGNLAAIPHSAEFHQVNYGNKEFLSKLFQSKKIDAVIHLAASSNVPHSVIDPRLYYENNIGNTLNLLESMQEHGVNKIIFSSSAAVYGEPRYTPVDEQHIHSPINPYGKTKLFLEDILLDLVTSANIECVVFRFFCAAGATAFNGEARKNETHLIPIVVDCALGKRNQVFVYGDKFPTLDGSGVRDYVHVADIAQAHMLALKNFDEVTNEVFNIGTDSGSSVLEVIQVAEQLFKMKIPYEIMVARPGDPATLVASSQKIRALLGWNPLYTLEQIVLSTYLWRKEQLY